MILVFGSINLDLGVRVARLPRAGETVGGNHFSARPGGKGANQALAAQRAGCDVCLAGAVGDDFFAGLALANLEAEGVDLSLVRRLPMATGVALIHVDGGGENCITVVAGANGEADADWLPDARLNPATLLVLQLESPLAAVCALAERARARGARVVLNAAPALVYPAALLESLDVIVVNALEADALAARLDLPSLPGAFAVALHRRFGLATIVTLGADGALAAAAGHQLRVPAPRVDVRDTTGAGDAFTGALAAALDRGSGWLEALADGVAAGSLACTGEGAQAALPTAAAIHRLAAAVQPKILVDRLD